MTRLTTTALFFTLAGVYVAAWLIQASLPLNYDVTWLIIATERLWQGGTYSGTFFETTPPFVLYLYSPPLLFAKYCSLSLILAIRLYFFALITVSLCLCQRYLRQLIDSSGVLFLFLITFAVITLILPVFEFGQREHLLVVFMMPYLLAVSAALQTQKRLPLIEAILIGLFASCGFLMKPYFLLCLICIECYVLCHKRSLSANLRPETLTLFILLLIYLASIGIKQPDYLLKVAPFAARNYYIGMKDTYINLFFNPLAGFMLLTIPVYLFQYHKSMTPILSSILMIAFVSLYSFVYLLQQTVFYYHFFPAYSMSLLLFVLAFKSLIQQPIKWMDGVYFLLIINLFILFLYINVPPIWNHFGTPLIVLIISFILIYLFTALFFMPCSRWQRLFIPPLFAAALIIVFLFPIYQGTLFFLSAQERTRYAKTLSTYIQKTAPHQSVYFFSTTIVNNFPLPLTLANIPRYASRFPFFWMLPGLLKNPEASEADKSALIEMITADLEKNKPALVFIDNSVLKAHLGLTQFDYLPFLLKNAAFQKAWQPYHYQATIAETTPHQPNDAIAPFEFRVYKRVAY